MRKKHISKNLLVVLSSLLILGVVNARELTGEPVTAEVAGQAAEAHVMTMKDYWSAIPELEGMIPEAGMVHELRHPETKELLGYVVDLKPRGFVAVAGNTAIHPVIAYSFRVNFPMGQVDNPLYWMLEEDLSLRLQALEETDEGILQANNDLWSSFLSPDSLPPSDYYSFPAPIEHGTGGYVNTVWHQGEPYNSLCPLDSKTKDRCLTGSEATAMAQIVNYWGRKFRGLNFSGLNHQDMYVTSLPIYYDFIDADANKFDYPTFKELNGQMISLQVLYLEHYRGHIDTIYDPEIGALLSFVCGITLKTSYSSTNSSGNFDLIDEASRLKFQYPTASELHSDVHDFYDILLRNMLDAKPAILKIEVPDSSQSVHAIVCDGVAFNMSKDTISGLYVIDFNEYYHLNFGWGVSDPDTITLAWYQLPQGLPKGYSIVSKGILNICRSRIY